MLEAQYGSPRDPPVTTDQYYHRASIWRVILDIISLLILLIVAILLNTLAKPFTRGFFCSDETIRYPYRDDTIPVYALIALSIGIPLLFMWFTEIFKRLYMSWYPMKMPFITHLQLCGRRVAYISPFVRNLYILTVVFALGYLITWVLTEMTKNFVGELRPHFLAVCQPSYNCSAVTSLYQYDAYLQEGVDYTCQNTDASAVREARRSFFSGHSSIIFYAMAWLIMYIHVAWSWRHLGIIGHVLQLGFALLAIYIAYTRISDFHHHWHDVLVGAIVGSLIAFVVFKFILNWRHYSPRFLPYTVTSPPLVVPPSPSPMIPMRYRSRPPARPYRRSRPNARY